MLAAHPQSRLFSITVRNPVVTAINIGLLWQSAAAGNLGVGALTIGNIALIRRATDRLGLTPHFTIFGARERGQPYVIGPDISHSCIDGRYMVSPSGYAADVRRQHIMLDIGAGDSFTDIYTNKRYAYIIGTKLIPLMLGVPLILSPQTIGPFSRQPHKALAGFVCNRATHVFTRDPISTKVVRAIAPRAKSSEVIDVAFALPFTRMEFSGQKVRIGVSVSGLLLSGGYNSSNDFGLGFDFGTLIRGLISHFLGLADTEVYLIAHVYAPQAPRDDDASAIDALHAEFPGTVRAPDFASPSDAKSYISGLDFVIGARMHATIAAFSSGVPVVPISYSNKFEGLYSGLNYPYLVNAKGMNSEQAQAMILDCFDNRGKLQAAIAAAGPIIDKALDSYVDELTRQFAAALAR